MTKPTPRIRTYYREDLITRKYMSTLPQKKLSAWIRLATSNLMNEEREELYKLSPGRKK